MDKYISKINIPNNEISVVFGELDCFAKIIEKETDTAIIPRDDYIKIVGNKNNVRKCEKIINNLSTSYRNGNEINEQAVKYAISLGVDKDNSFLKLDDIICYTTYGKPIKPKTVGQKAYIDSMKNNMITFGIGPAGTGKTYLAMAMAISAFQREEVGKIILTRPAIEAGEKLGFLPGDLQSKVDPYLRPLYDALHQIMGAENFIRNMEKGLIEVAPLAYMRGRTLDNSYIILDEAQNTTSSQMKMFLTRIGFGSKAVITGDNTQIDLPKGVASGLDNATNILSEINNIGICTLTGADVVRHPLVQEIVNAYEKYENKKNKNK
ncbi:MAG: PhoH family protein [Lachnospiraceae bacterium]|nr:PhoH family protein [Lachnospiraceae bacterium]